MSDTNVRRGDPWALGGAIFAAAVLVMLGGFHVIQGFVAIAEDEVFARIGDYVFEFDVTTWGWIHLIVGLVFVAVGLALFTGATWARAVAIAIAVLSALLNFMWVPYQPWWSLAIIALDVFVIWALATYRADD
jgi:hypothetical protein